MNKHLIYQEDAIKLLDALENRISEEEGWQEKCDGIFQAKELIAGMPEIKVESVRHIENTTVIYTDDVREWKSRVMVCERNSHWGRLYYESDTRHGRWIEAEKEVFPSYCGKCSECGKTRIRENYCPNCGAKMDLED